MQNRVIIHMVFTENQQVCTCWCAEDRAMTVILLIARVAMRVGVFSAVWTEFNEFLSFRHWWSQMEWSSGVFFTSKNLEPIQAFSLDKVDWKMGSKFNLSGSFDSTWDKSFFYLADIKPIPDSPRVTRASSPIVMFWKSDVQNVRAVFTSLLWTRPALLGVFAPLDCSSRSWSRSSHSPWTLSSMRSAPGSILFLPLPLAGLDGPHVSHPLLFSAAAVRNDSVVEVEVVVKNKVETEVEGKRSNDFSGDHEHLCGWRV